MRNNFKIVAITPAGRKRYLEILYEYLKKHLHILDEWHLWINTENQEDIKYIKYLNENNSWIKTFDLKEGVNYHKFYSIGSFFTNCTDENSIYIRFDDDIVFIENGFFESMIDFRIKNPKYFLVFPVIINNGIVAHLLHRFGCLDIGTSLPEYTCFDKITYHNAVNARLLHEQLIKDYRRNNLNRYKFKKWELYGERISINSFLFFGKDFKKFDGIIDIDSEEFFLTVKYPLENKLTNCIYGGSIVSHFSFHPQEDYLLNETRLLERYKKLAQ